MFDHRNYVSGGYDADESMGDLTDSFFDFAASLLPGGAGALLTGADLGSGGALSPSPSDPFGTAPSSSSSAKVTAPNGLKLRAQPNENSTQKAMLSVGTPLTVIKTGFPSTTAAPKGWTQVRTESGAEGYVSTEWLSISSPTSASSGNTSTAIAPASSLSATKPTTSSSIFDNKLLLIGGGVAVVAVVAALALGGKKKAA